MSTHDVVPGTRKTKAEWRAYNERQTALRAIQREHERWEQYLASARYGFHPDEDWYECHGCGVLFPDSIEYSAQAGGCYCDVCVDDSQHGEWCSCCGETWCDWDETHEVRDGRGYFHQLCASCVESHGHQFAPGYHDQLRWEELSRRERIARCAAAGVSIFAARRDDLPHMVEVPT